MHFCYVPPAGSPAGQFALLHGADDLVRQTGVHRLEVPDQSIDVGTLRFVVDGTDVLDDGELLAMYRLQDLLLRGEDERSYHGEVLAGQVCDRFEAVDGAEIQKVHEERVDRVVPVVAEGEFVTSQFLRKRVETAPSQVRAKTAGVLFVPSLEDYVADVRLVDNVLDIEFLAHVDDGRVVHAGAVEARVERDADDLKLLRIVAAHVGETVKERDRILAAGDPDRDLVAVLDHVIPVHGTAHVPLDLLHGLPSSKSFPHYSMFPLKSEPVYGKVLHVLGQLAQLVRAPASHAGGRRFESYIDHQKPMMIHWLFSFVKGNIRPVSIAAVRNSIPHIPGPLTIEQIFGIMLVKKRIKEGVLWF